MSRDQRVQLLIKLVESAQKQGAFLLRESSLLKKAKDYFNPDLKDEEKPSFTEDDKDPELIAQDLLMQAVEVGNRKGAYGLEEAAMAYELVEHLRQEIIKSRQSEASSASASAPQAASAPAQKTRRRPAKQEESEEDEDEADEELASPAFRSLKGKSRAA